MQVHYTDSWYRWSAHTTAVAIDRTNYCRSSMEECNTAWSRVCCGEVRSVGSQHNARWSGQRPNRLWPTWHDRPKGYCRQGFVDHVHQAVVGHKGASCRFDLLSARYSVRPTACPMQAPPCKKVSFELVLPVHSSVHVWQPKLATPFSGTLLNWSAHWHCPRTDHIVTNSDNRRHDTATVQLTAPALPTCHMPTAAVMALATTKFNANTRAWGSDDK